MSSKATAYQICEKALQDKVKAEERFERSIINLRKKNHAYAVAKDAVRAQERREGNFTSLRVLHDS